MKLKYRPIRTLEKIEARLVMETNDLSNNDFVELIMYTKDEGVLMTGKMIDGDNDVVNITIFEYYFIVYFRFYLKMSINLK